MEKQIIRTDVHLDLLRAEVEETFGRRIGSSRDCNVLSEEIYTRTSCTINPNTLRRFFRLVKAEHPPSGSTVEILARYCGFRSIEELVAVKKHVQRNDMSDHQNSGILNYFTAIFSNTPTKGYHDTTFLSMVKLSIQFLQLRPELFDPFHRAIAKTKNGQEYYFEQFVNIDALGSHYGEGLHYYLKEKQSTEAQVFGHSLLCLRGWLTDDAEEVEKNYEEVMRWKIIKGIHNFVCARYFVSQLLYRDIRGLETESVLVAARKAHMSLKAETDRFRGFPCFEYVMSPALLLTGHHEEALYYCNYALQKYNDREEHVEEGFYQTLDLIKALTYVKTGDKEAAEKLYEQIKPSAFYFLTKKINTIMYLTLMQLLKKNHTRSDQQLAELIEQTGFTKLLPIVKG